MLLIVPTSTDESTLFNRYALNYADKYERCNMRRRIAFYTMLLCVLGSRALCADDRELTFEHQIRPILKAHCFRCHGEDEPIEGNLDLRLVRFHLKGGDSGPAVVPGQPDESPLLTRIRAGEMPPEGASPLKPEQVRLIEDWIRSGAKTLRPEPLTAESSAITEDDRNFWAFQPLKTGSINFPSETSGVRNFIDALVRQRLEQEKLPPSDEADRHTLLRRLTFTLIGLPPTWEEQQAFLADESPDAYERVVDRLLASPHHGERWARFWLDLGRYVDETPWWVTSAKNAWVYRDWIAKSFNEDRPYDDFVRRQLATDQMDDARPADNSALGFLGLSPSYWKELRLSVDVIKTVVAEENDERIDTISRTFLGLTLSCARCHDHKFDPLTMRDYYALAGVVASTQLVDKPQVSYSAAETVQVVRQQIADLQARIAAIKALKDNVDRSAEVNRLETLIGHLRASTPDFDVPWVHAVEDTLLIVQPEGDDKTRLEYRHGEVADMPIFRRGNPSAPMNTVVPRRYLSVLSPAEPQRFQKGSGRLELANSILTASQPLASRVQVNRLWAQHLGKGIVRTLSDFGRQGEPPTHPELLDALAAQFIEHGWSHKWLHRRIVESATFRQSSRPSPEGEERDPDNKLLWRMHRRRLDIEPYRDAILAASGRLDDRLYGPSLTFDDALNVRRTLYGKVVREEQHSMLRLYDFPDASAHSPGREQTTTSLQQLFVMNGPLFRDSAVAAVQAVNSQDAQRFVEESYRRIYQRMPSQRELELGMNFIVASDEASKQAYLHALLGSNEFLFLD